MFALWSGGINRESFLVLFSKKERASLLPARQPHDEAGADDIAVGVAAVFRADAAFQSLDDLPADGEAEAGVLAEAFVLGAFGIEAVEDVFELGVGDARARHPPR